MLRNGKPTKKYLRETLREMNIHNCGFSQISGVIGLYWSDQKGLNEQMELFAQRVSEELGVEPVFFGRANRNQLLSGMMRW